MDALRFLARRNVFQITCLLTLTAIQLVSAQDSLPLFTPVTGTLSSGGLDRWEFTAADGALMSASVQATSDDLDPVVTIRDRNGELLFNNDDYRPDSRDARLEAFTIPGTGTYTLEVSSFGETAGDYELTLLAGFAALHHLETFADETTWHSEHEALEIVQGDGRMALLLNGIQEQAIAIYDAQEPPRDHFVQVDIPELIGANGWQVGLVTRQQSNNTYYAYHLNNRGEWRFTINTPDGQTILRDWSIHPAIIPGQNNFTIGLLANETSFEFFYDSQLIGRATDATIVESGAVGLLVATPPTAGSEVVAQFQNLAITVPSEEPIIPQQLATGNSTVMIPELQRRRLIPPSGTMGLVVPESFITFNRPGVNELSLGGDQTFTTFALGATVTWDIATPELPAGCGIVLRQNDETHYWLAYLDQTGAYGLSQRENDRFEPGIFGSGINVDQGLSRLLVIANDEHLLYYVNGQLAGMLEVSPVAGGVGNAVINFEPTTTSCQFTDTWVWSWE